MGYISQSDIKDIESSMMNIPRPIIKSLFIIGASFTTGFIFWISQI